MTVRYGEVHKLIWRVVSKDCTLEVVGADCHVCNQHSIIVIHPKENHARCIRCMSLLDSIPAVSQTRTAGPESKSVMKKIFGWLSK